MDQKSAFFSIVLKWFLSLSIPFFFICNGVASSPVNLDGASRSAGADAPFSNPPGCPVEHYIALETVTSGTNGEHHGYKFGDEIRYKCKFDNELELQNQHMVFPSANRTCQLDGTWTGVPPACLRKGKIIQTDTTMPLDIQNCSANHCTYERYNWPTIGFMRSKYSQNANEFSESREINGNRVVEMLTLFTFPRHVYLNFMTFSWPHIKHRESGVYHVEVKAPSDGVIQDFSPEASKFLEKQHAAILMPKDIQSPNERAIIRVGVYSRQVLVRFSLIASQDLDMQTVNWIPLPKFYSVPEVVQSGRERSYGEEGSGCAEPPTIPNAVRKYLDNSTHVFLCQSGNMFNPKTNKPANRISCHRGHEWEPYPFPVCRSVINGTGRATQSVPSKHEDPKRFAEDLSGARHEWDRVVKEGRKKLEGPR